MAVWFCSDTHFGHKNILRYCDRPYSGVEEMNQKIIENWNGCVKPEDTVYHLGDVGFMSATSLAGFVAQLNGKKHLILGNHDKGYLKKELFTSQWESIQNYLEIKIQDSDATRGSQHIILCHYPLLSWNHMHHNSWHLHGHCHGNIDHLNNEGFRIDIGLDSRGMRPVSYPEVKEIMSNRATDF